MLDVIEVIGGHDDIDGDMPLLVLPMSSVYQNIRYSSSYVFMGWVQLNFDSEHFAYFAAYAVDMLSVVVYVHSGQAAKELPKKVYILVFRLLLNGSETKDVLLNPS